MTTTPCITILVLLCMLASFSQTRCSATLVNVEVKRIIDASTTIAITRSTISMKNTGETAVDSFILAAQHPSDTGSLHDVWVSEPSSEKLTALAMEAVHDESSTNETKSKAFKVMFSTPLQPGREVTVDVRMDVANAVKPVPAKLSGHDSQYMRYEGSIYAHTPYKSESMETTVILGSSTVTSKHGVAKPTSISGKRLKLGPYTNVAANSFQHMSVRFKNDHGFLVARRATKRLDVRHWGSIPTREEYEVRNAAAKHEGEWSRIDYAGMRSSAYKTAIGDVWANLPKDATSVVYRDLIGNITSSRLREPTGKNRPVQLTFRYPMMGGWQNHFWVNYDLAHDEYVQVGETDASAHTITIPIFPSLNTDLLCEELNVRVLLPEWSDGIEVDSHRSLMFEQTIESERTSLTLFGRPVVLLKANMVRSNSKHNNKFVIRYKYNPMMKWVSPLVTVFATLMFITFLVTCIKTGFGVGIVDDHIASMKIKTT